jgi:protein TonB
MTAEAVVVACAVIIPLAFPNMLPKPLTPVAWLQAPAAPQPRVEPAAVSRPAPAHPLQPTQIFRGVLYQPKSVPAKPQILEDAPGDFAPAGSIIGGDWSNAGNLLKSIIEAGARILPAPPPVLLPAPGKPVPPARVPLGGEVKEAVLLHRVEPVYPALARQTRVLGQVELEGVIGTDGRIRELKLKGGNPLLVSAAMNAVRQWIYKPTLLNGTPVEVELMIVVNFQLN